MNLFEIDKQIELCIDEETGEFNEELYNQYEEERLHKIENLVCLYKNIRSDVEALKAQEKSFTERRKAEENKAEKLKEFIAKVLNGDKMKTAKVSVSYRKSSSVVVSEDFVTWAQFNDRADLLRYKDPEPDKEFIKKAILLGEDIPADIVESNNIQIK